MTVAEMNEATLALWIGLASIWLLSAARVKQSIWREPSVSQSVYTMMLLIAAILMLEPVSRLPSIMKISLGFNAFTAAATGFAITASGIGIALWARLSLGSNWSAAVTIKVDHKLICTGPYRFVRHPMYSGFLLAFAGTALASDQFRALPAFLLVLLGLIYKSRVEERQLAGNFRDYQKYRRATAALIPFVY
jgi:protein-S-isoprenylcysteine O-methyltransferase Ste14